VALVRGVCVYVVMGYDMGNECFRLRCGVCAGRSKRSNRVAF